MHVLDPKEEEKITVVPNALPLTVELLRPKLSFGFGFVTECLNVCGKNVWSLWCEIPQANLRSTLLIHEQALHIR